MKKAGYNQCHLRNGNVHQVAFIPEQFARKGATVKIRNEIGEWVDGWLVEFVGTWTDKPPDINKAIRGHRDNTGDSLPKAKETDR